MVYVPSAEKYGFRLHLNGDVMREVLNGPGVKRLLKETANTVRDGVVSYVQATASANSAANYVESLFREDTFSDEYGFDFGGPYALGNRLIAVIGVPAGRGANPSAKPPLLVESETHALTSQFGVSVDSTEEDIR